MSEPAVPHSLRWDLVDRLHKSLRVGSCKPGEMAALLGVSPATMTNYLGGKTRPKDGMLRQWAMRCGVPFDWLVTGEIDLTGGDDRPPAQVAGKTSGLGNRRKAWNGQVVVLQARGERPVPLRHAA